MDTSALKKFAQEARRQLLEQVAARMEQVLQVDSIEVREKAAAVAQLREQIAESSKEAVIDSVAYTWFNRFCALRYMDVNHYTRMGIVSPQEGFTQPEILAEAKQGVIDETFVVDQAHIIGLLNGQIPSANPQQEAYRLLLVGASRAYHAQMPFLFPEIEDYTALLMPEDLLSENSILHSMRQALDEAACEDVEVIGWLYQYYISERKDEVFAALKKNKKIEAEDIPAATQLFTPHWIVRYLVENSLGRLWMLNHPESKLVEQMEYYIAPVTASDAKQSPGDEKIASAAPRNDTGEVDFLRISSPEEIKICDPACGSGHMLTYAYDLLYAIYEEQGYDPVQIPQLILQNNLYGIEIDSRAGALAAFALTMKARARDRRFLGRGVLPHICVLENVAFTQQELDEYMRAVGRDLFTAPLLETLQQFEQADNFGSLIRPTLTDAASVRGLLESRNIGGNLFLFGVHERVLKVLKQAEFLAPRYHVVVANPPYMGGSGMNEDLKEYLNDIYTDVKSDLFSAFIVRNSELAVNKGHLGFMTPFVWMFISSYEKLRTFIIDKKTITSLIQLEYSGFEGAVVPICTFTFENAHHPQNRAAYIKLSDFRGSENQSPRTLEAIRNPDCGWFYQTASENFKKIPGSPIAYWLSDNARKPFEKGVFLGEIATTRVGMATGDNDRFVRFWYEVANGKIGFSLSREEAAESGLKWFPYSNGGEARKWYANYLHVVNWENDGYLLQTEKHESGRIRAHNFNLDKIFFSGLTWSLINSAYNAIRVLPKGFLFSSGAPSLFADVDSDTDVINGFYNSSVSQYYLKAINPTLNNNSGDADKLPFYFTEQQKNKSRAAVKRAVEIAKADWDAYEISWDYAVSPLINEKEKNATLKVTFSRMRNGFLDMTRNQKILEEENNRVYIEAYGLEKDMSPDVSLGDITLTCNPNFRYGSKRNEGELEELLLADTMKEFISYAVGCMFGRYSLDKPGLVLANQGETLRDYQNKLADVIASRKAKQSPHGQEIASGKERPRNDMDYLTFPADDDNVIPVLDEGWFDDDIVERFKRFLRVTFGEEHYEENLAFLENAIGRDIRGYFLKDFYKEHLKMYKKRPIYWLFSSPNGSFNALIYMHRYRPDTVSIILNDYLRQYREKISAHKAHLQAIERDPNAGQGEKTKALREIDKIDKVLAELREYEDEILYPLATQQIQIDLDDGVKANYPKFGKALKKVSGLSQ